MALKLITICWSTTIRREVPDEFEKRTQDDFPELKNELLEEASGNCSWREFEITDVQEEAMTLDELKRQEEKLLATGHFRRKTIDRIRKPCYILNMRLY